MKNLRSKLRVVLILLLFAIIQLYAFGKKSVHEEIVINAPVESVWKTLISEIDYPKWNQVLVPVNGKIQLDNELDYYLIRPDNDTLKIKMHVAQLLPNKLLNQKGGFPGVFTFDHHYILTDMGNKTKVTIHENFNGIAIPFWNNAWLKREYSELLHSLNTYIKLNEPNSKKA